MSELDCKRGERFASMLLGTFIGDAHAMPAHWYYDRNALRQDYGWITDFLAPRNPHPDSILWRSHYKPLNAKGDILHQESVYWGKRGIHYHQHLEPGENTLSLQLACLLLETLKQSGKYDADAYLMRYRDYMLTPGNHRDTYIEECHRQFFTNYARGKKLRSCGGPDNHIGGLASAAILLVGGNQDLETARAVVKEHIRLTHHHAYLDRAADSYIQILWHVLNGQDLRNAIEAHAKEFFSKRKAQTWEATEDGEVVDHHFSSACYIDKAFPASLYLAWKYADSFREGIIANTNIGGDNCHRGAVVGALLGAAAGLNAIPEQWINRLKLSPRLADLQGQKQYSST